MLEIKKTNKKGWNKTRVSIIDLDINAKINLQFIKWIPRPVFKHFKAYYLLTDLKEFSVLIDQSESIIDTALWKYL